MPMEPERPEILWRAIFLPTDASKFDSLRNELISRAFAVFNAVWREDQLACPAVF